ncbi:hypothetical protein ES705_18385 [subsurface metagenome]
MPLATVDIEVFGVAAGLTATFTFGVNVTVRDPQSGSVHAAAYQECFCELSKVRVFWPDVELQQLETPTGGHVRFSVSETIDERTEYKLNAQHHESGDYKQKRIECNPDGSWKEIPDY